MWYRGAGAVNARRAAIEFRDHWPSWSGARWTTRRPSTRTLPHDWRSRRARCGPGHSRSSRRWTASAPARARSSPWPTDMRVWPPREPRSRTLFSKVVALPALRHGRLQRIPPAAYIGQPRASLSCSWCRRLAAMTGGGTERWGFWCSRHRRRVSICSAAGAVLLAGQISEGPADLAPTPTKYAHAGDGMGDVAGGGDRGRGDQRRRRSAATSSGFRPRIRGASNQGEAGISGQLNGGVLRGEMLEV